MNVIFSHFLFFAEALIYLSVVFMHILDKNSSTIRLYVIQSVATSFLFVFFSLREFSLALFLVASLIFMVKVVIAPYFFSKLVLRHHLTFAVSTYASTPLTLVIIMGLTALAKSSFFTSLALSAKENGSIIPLSIASILISLFLIVNRKGALSQMVGVLSLENGIVSWALSAGLSQSVTLEFGIIFDLAVWIVIASMFGSMIYAHFGTLDVTEMKRLKEE